LPEQPLELEGRPAILVRYEDVLGQAAVNVFFAAETLQVIRAETG
jgi:hypothetical protein